MPITYPVSDLFGLAYLDAQSFRNNAGLFGARIALSNFPKDENDSSIVTLAASASRVIDSICGRHFKPDPISENHPFDFRTRRTRVNSPPVVNLSSYAIRTGAGTVSSFPLNSLYINNEESYIELLSIALAYGLTSQILTLGMNEPQVEITYTSFQTPPAEVSLACGYVMAELANKGFVDGLVPAGFGQLKVGGITAGNARSQLSERTCQLVEELLGDYIRFPIG